MLVTALTATIYSVLLSVWPGTGLSIFYTLTHLILTMACEIGAISIPVL